MSHEDDLMPKKEHAVPREELRHIARTEGWTWNEENQKRAEGKALSPEHLQELTEKDWFLLEGLLEREEMWGGGIETPGEQFKYSDVEHAAGAEFLKRLVREDAFEVETMRGGISKLYQATKKVLYEFKSPYGVLESKNEVQAAEADDVALSHAMELELGWAKRIFTNRADYDPLLLKELTNEALFRLQAEGEEVISRVGSEIKYQKNDPYTKKKVDVPWLEPTTDEMKEKVEAMVRKLIVGRLDALSYLRGWKESQAITSPGFDRGMDAQLKKFGCVRGENGAYVDSKSAVSFEGDEDAYRSGLMFKEWFANEKTEKELREKKKRDKEEERERQIAKTRSDATEASIQKSEENIVLEQKAALEKVKGKRMKREAELKEFQAAHRGFVQGVVSVLMRPFGGTEEDAKVARFVEEIKELKNKEKKIQREIDKATKELRASGAAKEAA